MSGLRPDLAPPPPQSRRIRRVNRVGAGGLVCRALVRFLSANIGAEQDLQFLSLAHSPGGTRSGRSKNIVGHSPPCFSARHPPGRIAKVLARPFRTRRVTIVLASCGLSNTRVRSRPARAVIVVRQGCTKDECGSERNAGRSPWDAFLGRPQFPASR